MDLKELKKLAAACRKAGILHFKSEQYEFTLSEEHPKSSYKKAKDVEQSGASGRFESDSLTEQDLLYWSTGTPAEILGTTEEPT